MPAGRLVLGAPARPVRRPSPEEFAAVREEWRNYAGRVAEYRRLGKSHGGEDDPLQDRRLAGPWQPAASVRTYEC